MRNKICYRSAQIQLEPINILFNDFIFSRSVPSEREIEELFDNNYMFRHRKKPNSLSDDEVKSLINIQQGDNGVIWSIKDFTNLRIRQTLGRYTRLLRDTNYINNIINILKEQSAPNESAAIQNAKSRIMFINFVYNITDPRLHHDEHHRYQMVRDGLGMESFVYEDNVYHDVIDFANKFYSDKAKSYLNRFFPNLTYNITPFWDENDSIIIIVNMKNSDGRERYYTLGSFYDIHYTRDAIIA